MIRFFIGFFPPVRVGSACPPRLFLVFSVSKPDTQRSDCPLPVVWKRDKNPSVY